MMVYLEVKDDKIINISDIESELTNKKIKCKSIDDFFEKISAYTYDEMTNLEDFVRELFEDEEISDKKLTDFKIKHWVSNRSFGELIDMYENNEIVVPNMQRNFVWDSIKCSRLIESIILGLPIPPLFLLEVADNKYELIDGFQRLTTLANFVSGRQWNYDEQIHSKTVPAKLSSKVAKEIASKAFSKLEPDYQMKIKRSTIPLIEFKQLDPLNFDSKYLIFERINTGSVRLNAMQIRKSLSYGQLIETLYKKVDELAILKDVFSATNIKKDNHVEAILRIICFYSFYYQKSFTPDAKGIKNILNEFCEVYKDESVDQSLFTKISEAIQLIVEAFPEGSVFKRVEKNDDEYNYVGNLNVAIFESMVSAVVYYLELGRKINKEELSRQYRSKMAQISNEGLKTGINPFSISTGSVESIESRFSISEKIVRDSLINDISI